jgi:hypothetical protein
VVLVCTTLWSSGYPFRLLNTALITGCGPGSSVVIAISYGLDGPGIESRGGRDFPHLSRPALGPTSHLYNGYSVFPGVKSYRGVTLTAHPLLVPWSWKGRSIPLLPLWAVRPVQRLSACTKVHFTFNQWPHKQHQHNSTCFIVLTQKKNKILRNIIESSKEKHVAQYLFKAIIFCNNNDRLSDVVFSYG